MPPIIRKNIEAIKNLQNTTNIGDKSSNKFLTTRNVEPNNIADANKANSALF